jgi:hypothetical protein
VIKTLVFEKNGKFFAENCRKSEKSVIITLVFEKNGNFFAENCRKSEKIVIITSTPGKLGQIRSSHIWNSAQTGQIRGGSGLSPIANVRLGLFTK